MTMFFAKVQQLYVRPFVLPSVHSPVCLSLIKDQTTRSMNYSTNEIMPDYSPYDLKNKQIK